MESNFSRNMNGRINSIVGTGLQFIHQLNAEDKRIGVVELGKEVAKQLEDDSVFCYHVLRAYINERPELEAVKGRHGGIRLKKTSSSLPPVLTNLLTDVVIPKDKPSKPAKKTDEPKRKPGRPRKTLEQKSS